MLVTSAAKTPKESITVFCMVEKLAAVDLRWIAATP